MIEISHLTRRYGAFTAVDDVSFRCEPGRVTGFLGPNGAGKTTTMRILVGLTTATSGSATIGGHRYADIPNPGRYVGTLLDASAQHAGRSGREILAVAARTMGLPDRRVDEVVDLVGLTGPESRPPLKGYTLGMRQRLGLAHALLGDPQVLILDEPANGLDPAGIRWMRDLLAGYARRGGTVLLSSHLLHEVEQVADEMVVIGRGRIVAQGDRRSLLEQGSEASSLVAATDVDGLVAALARHGHEARPEVAEPGLVRVACPPEEVGRVAIEERVVLTELRSGAAGLEDLFLKLTADTQRDAPAGPAGPAGAPDQPHTLETAGAR